MHVFSILPPRLGGLDMLLPIFMEIKEARPDTRISLLIFEDRVYSDLYRDPFLSGEVSRLADSVHRFRKPTKGRANPLLAVPAAVKTLLEIGRSKNPFLLHSRGIGSGMTKLFHRMVKSKGGKTYQHFAGSILTVNRTSGSPVLRGSEGDGFICYSKHDIRFLRNVQYESIFPVGYPRLYSRWIARVRQVTPKFLGEEYGKLGWFGYQKPLVLFLGSMVKELYSAEELKRWIQDVLSTAKKTIPETPILVKPHPVEKPHVLQMIKKIVSQHQLAQVTHLHPCILAAGAKLVVAHHSSTIIDSMGMGTPTIQYQEFTQHWLKRHPEGSSFLALGPLWAKDRTELQERFSQALSDKFTVPDVRIPLKHKMDLSILLG